MKKTPTTGNPPAGLLFDPWTASFEEADREGALHDWNSPTNPLLQWLAARDVEAQKARVDEDGRCVLRCINKCVTAGLVAPEWLAYAFNRRYYAVSMATVGSWDDPLAFGKPYPKGKHLAATRKANRLRIAVWIEVVNILERNPESAIDKGLFERIGKLKTINLGTTQTETYYYEAINLRGFYNPKKLRDFPGLHKDR